MAFRLRIEADGGFSVGSDQLTLTAKQGLILLLGFLQNQPVTSFEYRSASPIKNIAYNEATGELTWSENGTNQSVTIAAGEVRQFAKAAQQQTAGGDYATKTQAEAILALLANAATAQDLSTALSPIAKTSDLSSLAEKSDLASLAKAADLDPLARRSDLVGLATANDLEPLAKSEELELLARAEDVESAADVICDRVANIKVKRSDSERILNAASLTLGVASFVAGIQEPEQRKEYERTDPNLAI